MIRQEAEGRRQEAYSAEFFAFLPWKGQVLNVE
jgi:hypothetical protein